MRSYLLFTMCANGIQLNVLMEQFDWLVVYRKRMAVWSSATEGYGVQCVMTLGKTVMQQWCADSWAIVQLVSAIGVFTVGEFHVEKFKAIGVCIGVGQSGPCKST